MTASNHSEVEVSLELMRSALGGVAFSMPGPEDDPLEVDRRRLVKAISEYVLPHVTRSAATPVVVVIAGASGVGKSTLLNSLAQAEISPVSLTRPTTRHSMIWANRRPADDFWGQFIARVQDVAGKQVDIVVGDGPLASDVILVDTPPLDHSRGSLVAPAEDMLTLADLCIFVTSASRYADAAPYEFLARANRQGVPVLFVLNKTPSDPWLAVDLVNDFSARLSRRGLLPSPNPNLIFTLTLDPLPRPHQGLDGAAISPLREELEALADPGFRDEILRQTTAASLLAVTEGAADLAAALRIAAARATALRTAIDAAYGEQSRRLETELRRGAFAAVARRKSFTEAAAELAGIVTRRAGVASGRAAGAWERLAGGRELLARGGGGLYRHGEDTPYEAVEILEAWEQTAADNAAASAAGRLSGFARSRLRRFLWRAVLDPALEPQGSVRRRYGEEASSIVETARDSLSGALADALGKDAERFWSLTPDPVPDDKISALEDATASLSGATKQGSRNAVDEVPGQPQESGGTDNPPSPAIPALAGTPGDPVEAADA